MDKHANPADPNAVVRLIVRFNDALNAGDVDAMMRLMSADCVFENTVPAPEGTRYEGQQAVRAFWESFFRGSRSPHIDIEEVFAMEEHCVMRWVYSWLDSSGNRRHVRGVDIYRIRGGLITEKLSYVKG